MDAIFFFGRMHVLVLHIPVGVILLAVIADWISSRPRFSGAAQVATLLWGVAAVTGVMSVATGLMHASEGPPRALSTQTTVLPTVARIA